MKTKQEIHITTDGKITYAVLKQDGKVLSRSKAKCHPDDKFDFETGAKIAFDRLKIKRETEQSENPFKVGDIVEYISNEVSQFDAIYFPPKRTRGKIVALENEITPNRYALVQWGNGTTRGEGTWWCEVKKLKKVDKFPKYSFKVGDRVRFRSWDDLEREFGIDPAYRRGGISIKGGTIYFSHCMRPLCGTYATIETIHKYKTGLIEVKLKNFSCKDSSLRMYVFSTDMLEPASTKGRL